MFLQCMLLIELQMCSKMQVFIGITLQYVVDIVKLTDKFPYSE